MGHEQTDCLLCRSERHQVLFVGHDREHEIPGEFPVVQCMVCGLVYLRKRPDSKSLGDYYPESYAPYNPGQGWVAQLRAGLVQRRARQLSKLVKSGGAVLEVGCATGDFLALIRNCSGHRVVGLEMSEKAAEIGRARYGLDIRCGTVEQLDFHQEVFDIILMRHVLEHFPDPLAALRKLKSYLRPGGYLIIEGPNFEGLDRQVFGSLWYDYMVPRHLFIPSISTLRMMLDQVGLQVKVVRHSWLPNDWIGSVHNLMVETFGRRAWIERINFKNPFCIILGLPFGVLQKLLRRSGRIEVVAVNR